MKAEQNDLLTQTGPGTPMGAAVPQLLAAGAARRGAARERLPAGAREAAWASGCSPSATRKGRYGLIDEFCAHRGVSLWFGRNEESGLRCPYHGWKYDVTGQCIEVPSEPAESGFCQKIKLKSYPLVERGGVLWTYMGAAGQAAAAAGVGVRHGARASRASSSKRLQECNWLQAMEGGIDSSHVSFLHSRRAQHRPAVQGRARATSTTSATCKPVFEVVESPTAASTSARAATPRTATTTGASRRG